MTTDEARRAAVVAGAVTTIAGVALVAVPAKVAELLDLEDEAGIRAIGVSDLVLAPGLLAGTPRSPWLAARAVTNLVVAAYLAKAARDCGTAKPLPVVAFLAGITVVDTTAAAALRAASA